MRVLFLDVDGVLNRTAFHPGVSVGLRGLEHLRAELRAAGIDGNLTGSTPILGDARWREIGAWRVQCELALEDIVIIDDGDDMGPLASRFVRTSPLSGLDDDAVRAVVSLFPDR